MQTDMTVGKPMKMILDFTIPVFIGNVFQQFYNMADAIIVGKFVGTISARHPFSRSVYFGSAFTRINGTGFVVCAVHGAPVS